MMCDHGPRTRTGQVIWQWYCPSCGVIVVAGCPHPEIVDVEPGVYDCDWRKIGTPSLAEYLSGDFDIGPWGLGDDDSDPSSAPLRD